MQTLVTTDSTPHSAARRANPQAATPFRADHQFIAMLDSFRRSGGLLQACEVVAMFLARGESDITALAQWILQRRVISVEWQSRIWLPLFQFNRLSMAPQPGLSQVLAQLIPDHDGWALANWFAQPNAWLGNRTPAVMLGLDPAAVLNASRAARLIANG